MRAAVVRRGRIVVEAMPCPVPGPGQVLVKTLACGICGSDLHLFEHGASMMAMAERLGAAPDNLVDGLIMGHEFVAEIVEHGPDTRAELPVGQRVCALPFLPVDGTPVSIGASSRTIGAYAEYFVLPEAGLLPVPDHLDTAAAALTEPLAIGLHAVNASAIAVDETAVVIGCGPIGLACIAALRIRGVDDIVASDFSPKRRALAQHLGARQVVDAARGSGLSTVSGSPGCVVFECVDAKGLIGRIVREAPIGARVVIAGICSEEDSFLPLLAVSKELSFRFVSFYRAEEFASALDVLARGLVDWRPWISASVPLDGVAQAFDSLRTSDHHAKILIVPAPKEPERPHAGQGAEP